MANESPEILRARREMLNHISQRVHPLPEKLMKHYRKQVGGHVWRKLLRAERQPRRALRMPGVK